MGLTFSLQKFILAAKMGPLLNGASIHDFLKKIKINSIFFSPINEEEFSGIIRTRRSKTSTDSNTINLNIKKHANYFKLIQRQNLITTDQHFCCVRSPKYLKNSIIQDYYNLLIKQCPVKQPIWVSTFNVHLAYTARIGRRS